MEEGSSKVPDMRQEASPPTEAGFNQIIIEQNDSTTSYNKNFSITLVSKRETVKELIEIAKSLKTDALSANLH